MQVWLELHTHKHTTLPFLHFKLRLAALWNAMIMLTIQSLHDCLQVGDAPGRLELVLDLEEHLRVRDLGDLLAMAGDEEALRVGGPGVLLVVGVQCPPAGGMPG